MYRHFPHLLTILALLLVCGESAAQNTASSGADLSGLTLSAGTLAPAFARDSLSYTATVANSVTSLTVTPTSNHNGAAITVNGASVLRDTISSAISLNVGENAIAIVVTAEDGTTTKTYTVTVTRGVNIPDANLRNAIEEVLRSPSTRGQPISPSEMATLTYVDLKGRNVSTFVGLEYATNLNSLILADASMSDISALSDFTNLGTLNLGGNGISDISALSGLTKLSRLYLYGNNISDISALSGLTNLSDLNLSRNSISDISSLSGLANLSDLNLYGNNISDISSLSGLTNLGSLDLSYNNISDISSLSGLTNLGSLNLVENSISDISSLSGLTNLSDLNLYGNNISDISALSGLTNLYSLVLSSNGISDISALLGLKNLGTLYIQKNPLSYPSLTTHIPALQDRGVNLLYDARSLTRLVRISGDGQTGTAGSRLSDPLIVEVQDQNDDAFAGVPVVFSIAAGGGVLGTTTTTTDANGRASTTLTLGVAGANKVVAAIDVAGIDKSAHSDTTSFTATAIGGTGAPTDADLSGLTLSAGTLAPAFARDSLSYTATVANSMTRLTVTPTSNHDGAAITVNGASVSSGTASSAISLNVGENTIAIVVTAEDGTTTKTYTVIVTRGVNIPDDALRAGIEGQLKKSNGAIITPSEMATLTSLNPPGSIKTLTGLEYATNLRDLHLSDNHNISDISPLSGLTNLSHLDLNNNRISDISSLSGLTNLSYLHLGGNNISDISSLSGLTNLSDLNLSLNSRISDISSLSGLTNLSYLHLGGNNISDISSLSGLTNLSDLNLSLNNRISDISSLSGLTNLSVLDLSINSISDISSLSGLTNLHKLGLFNNSISDISSLSGLTNLYNLDLGRNSISDISSLSGLTNLYNLNLGYNSISNISSLSGLTNLYNLFLSGNNISDISSLLGLTDLDTVSLNSNPLSYPSLTIHIPALRARGVYVSYGARSLTRLVKISGDGQTGTAGSRLSDPLIVEVQDQNDGAFAGVPVAFSIAAGGGVLSTTTTTTDANGRASTTLTLGVAGANKVVAAIDVAGIDKSTHSDTTSFTATAIGGTVDTASAAISSTVPDSLTGENLDGAKVNITLTGATYNETLATDHFALHTAPARASIRGTPVRTSATVAQLTLAYAGVGFNANQSLRVTVKAAGHSGDGDLTTGAITVTPAQVTGPVTVVTEPGQVTGVTVMPGVGYLGVSWDVVSGATGYKVQWRSGDELYASDRQQVIDNGGKTSSAITGLTAGTEYTVRVIATLTNADDGPPSAGVTGTPVATTQPQPPQPPQPPPSADLTPSFGDSTVTAQRYQQGVAIAPLTLPTATGGDGALTYRLTPDLPSGLTFDATTRVLSGTPLEAMAETTYTLTATDEDGDAALLTFTLAVATAAVVTEPGQEPPQPPPSADLQPSFDDSIEVAAQRYRTGTAISIPLPRATGGDGALTYRLTPDLPSGLTFDATTRVLSGTPLEVMAETTYTLTATDEDGDAALLTFALSVASDSQPSFGDSYVTGATLYHIGYPVHITLPEATGGDGPLVYILLPFLPNGVRFDPATHTISGTPRQPLPWTEYTFSAVDVDGDVATLTFPLLVRYPDVDLDGNGRVDFDDFLSFVGKFGTRRGDAGYDASYDFDSDGAIGFSDFMIFALYFE